MDEYYFTSESVSEGHPDKICDQISDAILDEFLRQEPSSRVAVETLVTTNKIVIAGEVRGLKSVDKNNIEEIARSVVKRIGYEQKGFHWNEADVEILVHEQSSDIAQGVDANSDDGEGAGDQGLMFGYACNETDVFMPAAIHYAHKILHNLSIQRHAGNIPDIGPDSKAQVTLRFINNKVIGAESILVSTQHTPHINQEDVRSIIREQVLQSLPHKSWMCDESKFLTNPTGQFIIGGPDGDCGLTGRKIIVDTYGGSAAHGGGAFSGKDPTKVDRSAAYIARYLAKNVVAAGLSDKCLIQIAYAIGVTKPVSFYVDLYGSTKVDLVALSNKLGDLVNLTPRGIINHLDLAQPIYQKTATYGHFGRTAGNDGSFSWEKTDLVDELKTLL